MDPASAALPLLFHALILWGFFMCEQGLFEDAGPAFSKMGKKSLFLGAVGAGARMKLVVNSIMGCMMVSVEELTCCACR